MIVTKRFTHEVYQKTDTMAAINFFNKMMDSLGLKRGNRYSYNIEVKEGLFSRKAKVVLTIVGGSVAIQNVETRIKEYLSGE